jgi:hypothetical protein
MNIGVEFQTKEGNIYIANVVTKKIKKISLDGKKSDWLPYDNLEDGQVGNCLIIHRPGVKPTKTSEIVKLDFPKLGD